LGGLPNHWGCLPFSDGRKVPWWGYYNLEFVATAQEIGHNEFRVDPNLQKNRGLRTDETPK
jgi:hypothetical protein